MMPKPRCPPRGCPTPWCWGPPVGLGSPWPPVPTLPTTAAEGTGLGTAPGPYRQDENPTPGVWLLLPHTATRSRGRAGAGCSSRFIKATGNTASTFRDVCFKPTCLARKTSSRDSFQKRGENNPDCITPSEKDRKRYRNKRLHVWLCAIPEVPTSFFFFFFLNCTLTIRKWSWVISG